MDEKAAEGIVIVGLGPGGGDLLTQEAARVLGEAPAIYLRTRRHPAVADLPASVPVHSFDSIYEAAPDFATVYQQITAEVLHLGRQGKVVYAVPGHPAMGEATASQIMAQARVEGIPCRLVAGLSFVEPCLAAVGADGLEGLQLFDAIELADLLYPPLNPDVPALLGQLYSRQLAGSLKLALMALYPPDHRVALIHAAGTPEGQVEWLPLYEVDRSRAIEHLTSLYLPPLPQRSSLNALAQTVAVLRSPEGCPWDREQTAQSLRSGLLEEAAEVLEAIDRDDAGHLREELGDLLFHIVIQAQIAAEEESFSLSQVIAGIEAKLRRRHPHVWGEWQVAGSAQVVANWEKLKAQEKETAAPPASLLDGIPPSLPALSNSQKIQARVRRAGFDWPGIDGVYAKLDEELAELKAAREPAQQQAELGDLLFVVVNLAKWLDIDAESALRDANQRFRRRFRQVERLAQARQLDLARCDMQTLIALWEEAKGLLASNHSLEGEA